MDFEYLTDVHTGRNAQRVKNDVKRRTVGQERHILGFEDTGHNTLVSMTAGHFIAHGDFTLLSDIAAYQHIYSGRKLLGIFSCEYLNVNDNSSLAVRYFKGVVADFSCLFAEYGSEQSFLGGKLGLAFWRYLSYQNVACSYFCAYADNAPVVKVFESVLAHVGDIPCYLFGTQLGVAGFDLVFFYMNGGIDILADNSLVKKNRVLVVIALPCHEADKSVFAY